VNISLPINGLVNTSRTLGKPKIKMQQNFYIAKLRCSENNMFYNTFFVQ